MNKLDEEECLLLTSHALFNHAQITLISQIVFVVKRFDLRNLSNLREVKKCLLENF